jgi:deoxyadenosine/deoxycytidine kinase
MTEGRYIGFEGPIGAGKTTLAGLLARHLEATLILEDVDGNEFLAAFYAERERWALQMQLWFLTSRHAQLKDAKRLDGRVTVSDYTFRKDGIFARMLLDGLELRLYERVAAGLSAVLEPALVVYLDADNEVLLDRIKHRGRPYESGIRAGYLDSVRHAYKQHFLATPDVNVLNIDTTSLNLDSESELGALYQKVLHACAPKGTSSRVG